MHTHDQTTSNKLGMTDADKREARHDIAIQYLMEQERLIGLLRKVTAERAISEGWTETLEVTEVDPERTIFNAGVRYTSIVGYADLFIGFTAGPEGRGSAARSQVALIEVKIRPVTVGEIIRQVMLYSTYVGRSNQILVVATAFDLSIEDVAMLKAKGIHHVRLGAKFDAYCAERSAAPQKALSLEI